MKDDTVYLEHILECIRRVENDTSQGREHFLTSLTHQDAVLRNLQTLSESTQRLSQSLRTKKSEVEWERIAAFRNVLVHNYLGIDLEQIWNVVIKDVPVLKGAIEDLLRSFK